MRLWAVVRSAVRRGCAVGLIVAMLGLSCCSALAMAQTRQRGSVALTLGTAFERHGTASSVISDQRYAFAAAVSPNGPGVLFDDIDGRRETVRRPGCGVAGGPIVGGVLAFDCSDSTIARPELYLIASRSWRSVAVSPLVTDPCGAAGPCEITSTLTGAGLRWLQFRENSCPLGEHCSVRNVFQSIQTGSVAPDPAVQGGDQLADLDSRQLAHRVCAPLTIPEGFNIFSAPGPGDLMPDGQFALASSPGPKGGSQTYLERCGTHRHQTIESNNAAAAPGALAISPHAIAWQPSQLGVNIEFLPSRRRFRIRLPRAADPVVSELALTDDHLYVVDENDTLWITPLPAKPPPIHRR
jgi:hypothetical protein